MTSVGVGASIHTCILNVFIGRKSWCYQAILQVSCVTVTQTSISGLHTTVTSLAIAIIRSVFAKV